jgi:hypothetical protein
MGQLARAGSVFVGDDDERIRRPIDQVDEVSAGAG